MSAVHGELTVAEGVNAGRNDLAATVCALAGKADHAEQGALGDAEGNRGVVRFGAHWHGFGQPDFAPGSRSAVDAESLGLDHRLIGGGQTWGGRGDRFLFIILSERGKGNQQGNSGKENQAVDHGDPGGGIWSGRPDSNRRHRPWQGRTLPAELLPLSVKLYFYAETYPMSNVMGKSHKRKHL